MKGVNQGKTATAVGDILIVQDRRFICILVAMYSENRSSRRIAYKQSHAPWKHLISGLLRKYMDKHRCGHSTFEGTAS